METTEALKKKIRTAEDLQSVVKTMKALAAASIRQYEQAVQALDEYTRTIELGLHVVLRHTPDNRSMMKSDSSGALGVMVFGSDQGMCGQLNDQIVEEALQLMDALAVKPEGRLIVAVGLRAATRLEDAGQRVQERRPVPGTASAIGWAAQELLLRIVRWHEHQGVRQVVLCYAQPASHALYHPHTFHLLPLDEKWIQRIQSRPWRSRTLPTFTMDPGRLFSALIHQYFFVSLSRAFAASLASENASRLASMQGADRNIENRLEELQARFRQQRQMAITEELLDIVSGFQALQKPSKKNT